MKFEKYLFWLKFTLTATILLYVTGCSNKEGSQTNGEVILIPIDSIRVDVLNTIRSFDYDAENNLFLLGDVADATSALLPPGGASSGNKLGFIIVNSEGEIIGQFNNTEEGPNSHGKWSMSNLFLDSGKVGVYSESGFFAYDFRGELLKRVKGLNSRSFFGQPIYNISAFQNGNLALGYTKMTNEVFTHFDSLYYYLNSFKIFDLNGLLESSDDINEHIIKSFRLPHEIASVDPNKISGWVVPRMTIDRKRGVLNVLYNQVHKVYQYSIEDGSLLNTIDLKPLYFSSGNEPPEVKESSWMRNGGALINSSYRDMIQVGDYTLIRYNSAISQTQADQLVNSGGPSESAYWATLRQSSYKFYYLLIKGNSILKKDFQLDELTPQPGEEYFESFSSLRGQIIGGDGLNSLYVLYNNDSSKERPYKLIVRYELKID